MRSTRVGAWLGLWLLAGCNAVLGLDASTLEEGTSASTTSSLASSTTSSTTSSTSSTTSSAVGAGGNGGATTTSSSGGGGSGGDGGGGSDPCGTWGLIENGGFECGLSPWASSEVGTELETVTPGYGDRGTAARYKVVGAGNPVFQSFGIVEIAPSTCFVASYAARSSDGSGQVEAGLGLLDAYRYFRGPQRSLSTSFVRHGPLSCRIPGEFSEMARFSFSFSGLTDEDVTVAIDEVEVTLVPCAGDEDECPG